MVMVRLCKEIAKLVPTEDRSSPSPKKKYRPSTRSDSVPSFTAQITKMYFVSTLNDIMSAGRSLCAYGYGISPRPRNPLHINNTIGFR